MWKGLREEEGFDFEPTGPVQSMVHTHYTGLLPVFSADDLAAIYDLYESGYIADVENFYSVVVTDHGTIYALMISNPAQLKAFGDKFFKEEWVYKYAFKGQFVIDKYGLDHKNLPANYEDRFVQMVADGMGLSALKGDPQNPTSWKPLKLKSGKSQEAPCN
jgi:hypothetical protein